MTKNKYGISPDEEITPIKVRDAIVQCFYQAHCVDSGIKFDEEANLDYCKEIVKKSFMDAGKDFENPDKEGIVAAMNKLAEFSKQFREQEIIKKHYNEIMELVKKIK